MKKFLVRLLITVMVLGVFQTGNSAYEVRAEEPQADIYYTTHCQTYGWLKTSQNGELSGTEGQSKRLESIKIWVESNLSGSVEYETHCQTYGWLKPSKDGEENGTTGQGKRLEAIRISLTGELKEYYDVIYRVHRQTYGWSDWVKNGETCGTTGQSKRLEAIQIKIVRKGESQEASVSYRTHCQTYGWLPYVKNGEMSGTSGESKRLEAIQIDVSDTNCTGGITYQVHCQTYGWMDWTTNNLVAGTSRQAKRLEAIRIKLTGEMAEQFDIYYRVHSQTYGWLDWACNGGTAGTSGLGKRLEAIEIVLVREGAIAPGSTEKPYINKEMLDAQNNPVNPSPVPGEPTSDIPSGGDNSIISTGNFSSDINQVVLNPMNTNDPYIDEAVNNILKEIIKPDMTNEQKLWACYMWLINNASRTGKGDDTSYPSAWNNTKVNYKSFEDLRIVTFSHSILIGNGKRYGSCINYASAFVVLARALGFEAYRGAGKTNGGYTEHYWALVKVGDTYYNFDPEVPDTNKALNPANYFGKTKEEFEKLDIKAVPTSDGRTPQDYIDRFNNFTVK